MTAKKGLFVAASVLLVLITLCTLCAGSNITQWNSETEDDPDIPVDIHIDESEDVEFRVSSDLSYDWTWSINGKEEKESEGESSDISYTFAEYGIYNVSVTGLGENGTTECASWNVTVWLVIDEENDIRELDGLEDYTFKISKRPERIVSMAPSATEILFAVGAGDSVIGVTDYCDYPPEVKEKKDNGEIKSVGGYSTPSLEKIVDLEPDLIVSAHGNPSELLYWLVDTDMHPGIEYPVYAQHPGNIEDIFAHMEIIGELTKSDEIASSVVAELKDDLQEIEEKTELIEEEQRPRVYYAMGSILYTPGKGTFQHDVIEMAGGENIAAEYLSSWGVFSIEKLIDEDPQVILYSGHGSESIVPDQIKSDERLSTVDAVKNDRIYQINEGEISRPGPRLVNVTKTVYGLLYDLFTVTDDDDESEEDDYGSGGDSPSHKAEKRVIIAGDERTTELGDACLSNLTIKAEEDIEFTNISVNTLHDLNIIQPPAIVYTYFNLSMDNQTGSIEWLKLNFSVNKSWIAANANNNTTAISLFWYDYSYDSWVEQNASEIVLGGGKDKVYYSATSPSLGTFAICTISKSKLKLKSESEELQMPTPAVTLTPSATPIPVSAPTSTPTATPKPSQTPTPESPGFEAELAVVGLLTVMYLLRRNSFKNT
ncbi:MAG: helical backbone metal receptor [Euryarchaeota archaeon]|nr:helical backbone metal receptor [Euryarchaeota archaeon]